MIRPACILALSAAAALAVSQASAQQVLPPGTIDDSGNIKFGQITIGKRQGNTLTLIGDNFQIRGPGSTGPLDGTTVNGTEISALFNSKAPLDSPLFNNVVQSSGGAVFSGAQSIGNLATRLPRVGIGANLTGRAFNAPLAPQPTPIGSPNFPLAGIYANVISNTGNSTNREENINRYRAGILSQITAYEGSPDIFGMDIQLNHDQTAPTNISVIGLEIDMAKNGARDCANLGGPIYCAGFLMTGSSDGASSFGPAFLVEGVKNLFHYGYALNGVGVKDVGFFDNSQAATSFNIAGSHVTGIHFSGTITGQQIAGIGWSVDSVGNLVPASLTSQVAVVPGRLQIPAGGAPANNAACSFGDVRITASALYACTAPNSWKLVSFTGY